MVLIINNEKIVINTTSLMLASPFCGFTSTNMCPVKQGCNHGPAPIPEEGRWVFAKEIKDISGLSHGIGWCAPQQGACKLTLNVKDGIIEEALVETIGCSGMTHSAAMACEILLS